MGEFLVQGHAVNNALFPFQHGHADASFQQAFHNHLAGMAEATYDVKVTADAPNPAGKTAAFCYCPELRVNEQTDDGTN